MMLRVGLPDAPKLRCALRGAPEIGNDASLVNERETALIKSAPHARSSPDGIDQNERKLEQRRSPNVPQRRELVDGVAENKACNGRP